MKYNFSICRRIRFEALKYASRCAGRILGVGIILFLIVLISTADARETEYIKEDLSGRLEEIQKKIDTYRGQIKQKQQDVKSLNREIGILDIQIGQMELETEQTEVAIQKVEIVIGEKEQEIGHFVGLSDQKKQILSEYLRAIHEYDEMSLSEVILQTDNFSDFFDEIQSLESMQDVIKEELLSLKALQGSVEQQKSELEEEKGQYDELKRLQEIQKRSYQTQKDKKKTLLSQTKGQESLFKKLIDRAYSDVSSVRNQIYLLEGIGLSMSLEEALRHAELAGAKTGIRPAFLLAILKKESSWGTNVGTGYWRADMHPRDHKAYLQICRKLGVNPDKMPVSRKPSYGWGGAMGPAQFLPSTWLGLEESIAHATGHNPPNPWDIDDAFIAAGLKLSKNGANLKTYDAEWKAAMIYFAGSRWNSPLYRFYGDSVMELAVAIQEQIGAMGR